MIKHDFEDEGRNVLSDQMEAPRVQPALDPSVEPACSACNTASSPPRAVCNKCNTHMLSATFSADTPAEYDEIRPFQCCCCDKNVIGSRWWCDNCTLDACFDCCPEDCSLPPDLRAGPCNYARRLLRATSIREINEGVPYVCALLTKRFHIEVYRNRVGLSLKSAGISDHKVGFQRIVPLPGDPSYVVAHMSSHSARNVLLHPELCSYTSPSEASERPVEEVYFGVRACDPLFGGDISSRSNAAQFIIAGPPVHGLSRFRFAEIFAGIGGFRLGLEPLGGVCVFTSELNAAARETMAANFAPTSTAGDITGVYASQIPDFDILTAGFPCQPFSIRGEQGGLDDPRGQLFRELIRILKTKRPQAFLFENVPGLVYLNGGKANKHGDPMKPKIGATFKYILDDFAAVGYDLSWRIIDAKHWVPQNRQRVYIMGFRSDLSVIAENFWPAAGITCDGPGIGLVVRDILDSDPRCLVPLTRQQWEKQLTPEYIEKTNKWKGLIGGMRSKEIKLDEKAPTLTSGYKNPSNDATRYIFQDADGSIRDIPRFLTPRECCRLMGFPESFHIPSEIGISSKGKQLSGERSESLFFCQIGNAVCPPVIEAIAAEMLRGLSL